MRLPFLSGGNGLWGCGITFDIFTHGKPWIFFFVLFYKMITLHKRKYIHCGNLGEGYNVASESKKRQFL